MTQIIKNSKAIAQGDQPVMKLTEIASQAKEIVLDARKTAARIRGEARANAELAKKQAYTQGYDEGLVQGRAQGKEDGARQAESQTRSHIADQSKQITDVASAILAGLDEAGEQSYQLAADEILAFAIDVSAKIVGSLARTDISVARTNLIKALKLAHVDGEIIVAVNPGQLQELSADFTQFVDAVDASVRARLIADPQVAPGGVKIATARGVIDATVETQLDKVASALASGGLIGSPEPQAKTNGIPHLRIIDDDVSI
jgi:flagellar assembly protein FliH